MIPIRALALLLGAALFLISSPAAQAQTNLLDQLRRQPEQRPTPQAPASPPALDMLKRPAAPGTSSRLGPQARVVTPHGPDLLGVRLGMPMSEAEALVRRTISVSRVLDTPDPSPTQASALALRLQGRLFMTEDGKDQIAIFQGREAAADHVLGVWRKTNVGTDSWEKTLAALVLRHGPIATRQATAGYWGGPSSSNANCWGGRKSEWPVWRERDKAVPINQAGRYVQLVPELPLPNPLYRTEYEPCDNLLVAEYGATRDDSRSFSVVTRLFDMSVMAWLVSRPAPALTTPTPGEGMAAGPYGPDIVGLRLGMATAEADSLIRGHMHVGRLFEASPPANVSDDVAHVPKAYLYGRLFVARDESEQIALYEAPAFAPGHVVFVERSLYVSAPWEQVLASLTAKYGPPDKLLNVGSHQPVANWGGSAPSCDADNYIVAGGNWNGVWNHWKEDGKAVPEQGAEQKLLVDTIVVFPPPFWANKRDDYSMCGPVVRADYGASNTRPNATRVITRLFDQRFMDWLLAQPRPPVAQAAPVPNAKF